MLGMHQAFALIAGKCSAADAHALSVIRDGRLYKDLSLNWESFCTVHAGVCHKTADKIIDRLHEFGDASFNLSQIVPIRDAGYRAIRQNNHADLLDRVDAGL